MLILTLNTNLILTYGDSVPSKTAASIRESESESESVCFLSVLLINDTYNDCHQQILQSFGDSHKDFVAALFVRMLAYYEYENTGPRGDMLLF